MAELVAAIDQGTTSTRFMVFDHDGREVGRCQLEHEQLLPRAGWVEHDPVRLWQRTRQAIGRGLANAGATAADLVALGVANQRETTVVWNPKTGEPYGNAIVWQDTRTDRIARRLRDSGAGTLIRERSGLVPATYFSGGKLQWLLDHVDGLRAMAGRGEAVAGTIDSWLVWNLTGGPRGGRHVTDVTNAGRTMLMDLAALDWDDELLALFGVPRELLPPIAASADRDAFGVATVAGARDVPITAVLGDQHAAMIGQVCFAPGEAKNTYGTGNFMLVNTGGEPVRSERGLLTTLCYQLAGQPPVYALEGSIAVTGAAIQWLRDQLGIIADAAESERLAAQVDDSGDVYFVPAFSGLFAPRWRGDARGTIVGLSRYHTRQHVARAALEAICYQSREVADAMAADAGLHADVLKVDGGVTANALCMQLQADILGVQVSRPEVAETTALGAAYAAGLAVGYWSDTDELRANWRESRRWSPTWTDEQRARGYRRWTQAVERSLGWSEHA